LINIEKVASVASAMFAADMNTGAPASRSKCQTLALAELDSLILCRLGKVPCESRDVCRILGIPHCHFSQWSHLVILFKLAVLDTTSSGAPEQKFNSGSGCSERRAVSIPCTPTRTRLRHRLLTMFYNRPDRGSLCQGSFTANSVLLGG